MNKGIRLEHLIKDFPRTVVQEIMLHLNRSMIKMVPMFVDAEDAFITKLACVLVIQVFIAQDYIVRSGDIGNGMYFLRRGVCTVLINMPNGFEKVCHHITHNNRVLFF